ncbi:MAG: hypothetical protein OXG52_01630 [bacterium]|nr:hypothetical protein [bacterium]
MDLLVTDRPEWAVRSERLATAFERGIAAEAVVLHDQPAVDVNWGKEIGLPESDQAEAERSLNNTVQALAMMHEHVPLGAGEHEALADGDRDHYLFSLGARLRGLCAQAQTAIETSLKVLVNLHGEEPPPRTHQLDKLADLLPESARGLARKHLAGIDPEVVSEWRQRDTYVADFPEVALADLPRLAQSFAVAACGMASLAADQVRISGRSGGPTGEPAPTLRASKLAASIERVLEGWNLAEPSPAAQMGIPPPPSRFGSQVAVTVPSPAAQMGIPPPTVPGPED